MYVHYVYMIAFCQIYIYRSFGPSHLLVLLYVYQTPCCTHEHLLKQEKQKISILHHKGYIIYKPKILLKNKKKLVVYLYTSAKMLKLQIIWREKKNVF